MDNSVLLALANRLKAPKVEEKVQIGDTEVELSVAIEALKVLKESNWTSIKPALKTISSPLLQGNPQKVADKANKELHLSTKEAYCRVIELAVKGKELTEDQRQVVNSPIMAVKLSTDLEDKAFSGGMIALIPTAEDAKRLVVDDGLPEDDLHLTLVFLGEGSNYTDEERKSIVDSLQGVISSPVEGEAFSINIFNAHRNNPCLVLGASGAEIAAAKDAVDSVIKSDSIPEQHSPWVAHISLTYKNPGTRMDISKYKNKLGPVTFDRLRCAFGSDVYDIPLKADISSDDDPLKETTNV